MSDEPQPEESLPPHLIEGARSSRSKCKACRRKIDKGALRLGVLIEGPYGTGYLWHHLTCAARRRPDDVEQAYADEAWRFAKEPPQKVPPLEKLRALREAAERRREERKAIPYAESAPSGRARCKQCNELIAKDSMRVVLGREVEFGNQVRVGPINVHPACVAKALKAEDNATEAEGLAEALRVNSRGVPSERIESVIAEIERA
jgi:hypothetical protein